MAKPYGKRPNDWLNLQSTFSFINALRITSNPGNVDTLIVTKRGGLDPSQGGTWLHQNAALEFARLLDKFLLYTIPFPIRGSLPHPLE